MGQALVNSGGGLHLWWLLREPWAFEDADEREAARALLRGWGAVVKTAAARQGFDVDSVFDLSRVLRVPGTVNCKDPDTAKWSPHPNHRRPVTLLDGNPDRRYNPEDFSQFIPEDFDAQTATPTPKTKIAAGELTLPEGEEEPLARRFADLLQRDRYLRGQWERTADRKDTSASGYADGVASRLAKAHEWKAPELAWAVRKFYTTQTRPGDHALHATKLEKTVGNAMAKQAAAQAKQTATDTTATADDLAQTVAELVAAVKRDRDPAAVWAAAPQLATLSRVALGQVKQELKHELGQRLNLNDLEAAIKDARKQQRRASRADEGRPVVTLGRQLRDTTRDSLDALVEANDPPVLFVRSGVLTRLEHDEHGASLLGSVRVDEVRHRLAAIASFVVNTERGEADADVPEVIARNVLAAPDFNRFPPIVGVTESPVVRPDGSIVTARGYDKMTRMYYAPHPNLRLPPLPDQPTEADRDAALALLMESICDFPFVDEASRVNALAGIITPVVRPAILGNVPAWIPDAPQAGMGKGLLAQLSATVATGRPAAMFPCPKDDEEWRKRLLAALIGGPSIICIDNIEGRVEAPSLSMCLTTPMFSDRLMGRNDKVITVPQRSCFVLTGNNVVLGGDLPRRCYSSRIDAQTARPWLRKGFQHPNLIGWATEHRGDLLGAVLTLIRAWYADGKPKADVPELGSFEEWCLTLAGILAHAGLTEFLGNLAELWERADMEGAEWAGFLVALQEVFGEEGFTVGDICRAATSTVPSLVGAFPARAVEKSVPDHRRLGHALRAVDGKRFAYMGADGEKEIRVERRGEDPSTKTARWRVVAG